MKFFLSCPFFGKPIPVLIFTVFIFPLLTVSPLNGQNTPLIEVQNHQTPAYAGEEKTILIKISGPYQDGKLLLPPNDETILKNLGSPQRSQFTSVINGKVKRRTELIFSLGVRSGKEGDFLIKNVQIEVDGYLFPVEPFQVRFIFLPPNKNLKLALSHSGQKIYPGQELNLKATIEFNAHIENYQINFPLLDTINLYDVGINAAKYTGTQTEITLGPYKIPFENTSAVLNNNYEKFTAFFHLFPEKEGLLAITPIFMKADIQQGFEEKLDFFQRRVRVPKLVSIFSKSNAVQIEVLPFPKKNKPANFSGAVGQFNVSSSIKGENYRFGDAIPFTWRVEGKSFRFKNMTFPDILPDDNPESAFKIEPKSVIQEFGQNFAELRAKIYPKKEGTFVIPGIPFSFFDPESTSYKTITTAPIPMEIKIREILDEKDLFIPQKTVQPIVAEKFYANQELTKPEPEIIPWIAGGIGMPFIYGLLWLFKKQNAHNSRSEKKRRSKERHSFITNLEKIPLSSDDPKSSLHELIKELRHFLSSTLPLSQGDITTKNLRKKIFENIPTEIIKKSTELLERYEEIHFQPQKTWSHLDNQSLKKEIRNLIEKWR